MTAHKSGEGCKSVMRAHFVEVFAVLAGTFVVVVRQVWHDLFEQGDTRRDLRPGHFDVPLNMPNQPVENLRVCDFSPMAVVHAKACGPSAFGHGYTRACDATSC
jgi:hypothetical protein